MNSNFDIEDARASKNKDSPEEEDFNAQQFSGRLKSMMIFLVILVCVVTPYALNFQYARTDNSEQNLEDFLKVVDQDILGKTILGASLEERVGALDIPSDCAVFYSDDPEFNPNALSTKICPNEKDNHISFHIKGVFGTHPNNTAFVNGEKAAKVKFVATGTNVWATFFDQHNSTMQNYIVAPGNSIDIKTLSGAQFSTFYDDFDAVKILNGAETIGFKTKGAQAIYPECATFYESKELTVATEGFMVCHNFKAKSVQLKGPTLEAVDIDYLTGKTKPINYVTVGKKISVFMDFEKNKGMERITMEEGSIHDLQAESKAPAPGSPLPELRPKLVKLSCKDFKMAKKNMKRAPVAPSAGDLKISPSLKESLLTPEEEEEAKAELEEEEAEVDSKDSSKKSKKSKKSNDDE